MKSRIWPWCECGNERPLHKDTCERCFWLDGKAGGESKVVAALIHGEQTEDEIGELCGMVGRNARRYLDKLRARGRIRVCKERVGVRGTFIHKYSLKGLEK